jgi:hypothetical protein
MASPARIVVSRGLSASRHSAHPLIPATETKRNSAGLMRAAYIIHGGLQHPQVNLRQLNFALGALLEIPFEATVKVGRVLRGRQWLRIYSDEKVANRG